MPDNLKGRVAFGIMAMYVGDPADGARALQPLRSLGAAVDLMQPMPYTAFQAISDAAAPKGLRNYWRGEYLDTLTDAEEDHLAERHRRRRQCGSVRHVVSIAASVSVSRYSPRQ